MPLAHWIKREARDVLIRERKDQMLALSPKRIPRRGRGWEQPAPERMTLTYMRQYYTQVSHVEGRKEKELCSGEVRAHLRQGKREGECSTFAGGRILPVF